MMTTSDAAAIAESLTVPTAFSVIFDRHAAPIHRFLVRRVEPGEADDLLGEVFRIAFERRATFDCTRESARPWLYGIATHLVERHRRSAGRRFRPMAALAAQQVDRGHDNVGDRAAAAVDADVAWSMLVEVIETLPDAERQTLLLYAWEELGDEDIATTLGIPVGTVRSRLNRARRRLRTANVPVEPISPGLDLDCPSKDHPARRTTLHER